MQQSPLLQYHPAGSLFSPGTSQRQGYLIYWPGIVNLTGGAAATDLDAQSLQFLPSNTIIMVVISNRGLSIWERVSDNTSPVTNLDAGVIVPRNYDPLNNPWVLHRQIGY